MEIALSNSILPRVLILAVFSWLYSLGGRSGKWKRRWLAPIWMVLSVSLLSLYFHSFKWYIPVILLFLIPTLTLGYGHDQFFGKLARRAVYGLCIGLVGFVLGICLGVPEMGILQAILATLTSIYIGTQNPIEASLEEGFIALLLVCTIPFMV